MRPTLGESVVVTGLGLIGLITVQLLRAHGCRVLGIDLDPAKLAMARRFGAETVDLSAGQDPVAAAQAFSRGRGVDAVLITASTKSNEPVHQAALMCRKRGRIVLVGVVGLELSRADFYEKELTFQVSCSYGPGRYDPSPKNRGKIQQTRLRCGGPRSWRRAKPMRSLVSGCCNGMFQASRASANREPATRAEDRMSLVQGISINP